MLSHLDTGDFILMGIVLTFHALAFIALRREDEKIEQGLNPRRRRP